MPETSSPFASKENTYLHTRRFAFMCATLYFLGELLQFSEPGIGFNAFLSNYLSSIFGPGALTAVLHGSLERILKISTPGVSGILLISFILGKEYFDAEAYGQFDRVDFWGGVSTISLYTGLATFRK